MNEAYEVVWASVAEYDLLEILVYIAEENPENALDILKRIKSRTDKLEHSPMQGRVVPELLGQGISSYRELVIGPWRMIYKVEQRSVHIVSVLDSRRKIEDVLLARLLR